LRGKGESGETLARDKRGAERFSGKRSRLSQKGIGKRGITTGWGIMGEEPLSLLRKVLATTGSVNEAFLPIRSCGPKPDKGSPK